MPTEVLDMVYFAYLYVTDEALASCKCRKGDICSGLISLHLRKCSRHQSSVKLSDTSGERPLSVITVRIRQAQDLIVS